MTSTRASLTSEVMDMKILKHVHIKHFYTAEALSLGISHTTRNYSEYTHDVQYHCNHCGTDFMVEHRPCGIYWNGEWNDNIMICPVCGTKHKNFRGHMEIADEMPAPMNMRFTVTELKDAVLLTVRADTLTVTKEHDIRASVFEEFRFNVKTRVATWKQWYGGERMPKDSIDQGKESRRQLEISNPFDFAMYNHSLLRHVRSDNLARESLPEVTAVLKLLRDTLRRKWKEARHYDIGALFVSCGQVHGRMLFPLMNLAFRMTFPDAKNLPLWLSGTDYEIKAQMNQRDIHHPELFGDLAAIRKQESGVQGLVDAAPIGIELDVPLVKKLLHEDVFQLDLIVDLLKVIENHDYLPEAMVLVDCIAAKDAVLRSWDTLRKTDILKDLAIIGSLRDGKQIMNYLRHVARMDDGYRELNDTVSLMNRVPPEINRRAMGVKLKHVHDFLAAEYAKYKDRDYDLEVPEAVIRRLGMQLDQVRFFLPTRNAELQAGSREFRNCVKTYAERVHRGECQIVYMTDDRGKLVACLEVRRGKLVQAKLKFNKPVRQDGAVNGAVVDWCERAGLEVATYDVRKMRYPAVLAAVAG